MTSFSVCAFCLHRTEGDTLCDAFPDGIPNELFLGQIQHIKPVDGDGGIVFDIRDDLSPVETDRLMGILEPMAEPEAKRLGGMIRKTFTEADHPRDNAGKFGAGSSAHAEAAAKLEGTRATESRERAAAKLHKEVIGTQAMSQARAYHGEVGPNGETYNGGAFIATTDLPKRIKDKLKKAATGKVQTSTGWAVPEPGQMSIVDKLGGSVMNPRNGEINDQYLAYIKATPEQRAMYADLAEKHKAGQDWVSVNDYPQIAGLKDVARLYVAGEAIPGVVIDRLPPEYKERFIKWQAAKLQQSQAKP